MLNAKVLTFFLILLTAGACKYDDVFLVVPDPGDQISFSEDIIPIFNTSCNLAGCHNGSGPSPDLRAVNAYESLWSGGYIDTITPDNSALYEWMSGTRGLPMPVQGVNAGYVATVGLWIQQGALNN